MVLNSKSTTSRKMPPKTSRVSFSQRCLRSCNTRTVLTSKENKTEDPKCAPTSRKVNRRASSLGSHLSDYNGVGTRTPVLPSSKVASVIGDMKNSRKIVSVGKRSTRAALKVYDYPEADPDTENRPEGVNKKKSQTGIMAVGKADGVSDTKCKRSVQTSLSIPSKRKSVINYSYFLSGEKINNGVGRKNNFPVAKIAKTEPKLKKKCVLRDVTSTTNILPVKSDVSKCAGTIIKNVEKCISPESVTSDSGTRLASGDSANRRNLNINVCSTPIITTRVPTASLGVSPILAKAAVRHSVPSDPRDSIDKICEDVSEAFINVSSVDRQQEENAYSNESSKTEERHDGVCYAEIHPEPPHLGLTSTRDSIDKICEDVSEAFINVSSVDRQQEEDAYTIESSETEERHDEVCYAEINPEPPHLGLTSTPEKNTSSAVPCEYRTSKDSGLDDIVDVPLYDSPKKLSPIKAVDCPDSSLSDDSCCWDDDFESPPREADGGTPIKNDVQETLMKSFKAYHTPHQFRRHLFKKKSKNKKTLKKPKSKSPAEVKLDLWASVMNDHFEDIEGSELVIE